MSDPVVRQRIRRRRTWYRRRLRMQKTLAATAMVLLLGVATWQNVARRLALPRLHASQILSDSFWSRGDVHRKLAAAAGRTNGLNRWPNRRAYPYSVSPGGVRDIHELRETLARDYVVRRHYARFNLDRARLVHAGEERLVYMSYRRGDAIFWTRKKVHLHPDELLLTDGVITARARCGNQVSEAAQPEVAEEEPAEDVLDQPVAEIQPSAVPFRSSFVKPSLPASDPLPPSSPQLFAGGFIFPYVPVTAGPPVKLPCAKPEEQASKKCKEKKPPVPEPTTFLLLSSGLAGVYWRYRRSQAR